MTLCVTECSTLNKGFFRYCEKPSFWGKNRFFFFFCFLFFFGNSCLFRTFWSGVVGAIDTFVAEHVANMLS